VIESVGKPPTDSSAVRRKRTLVPQQNIASSASLPREIAPKNSACWAQAAAVMPPRREFA
jgi:hypothetical protein